MGQSESGNLTDPEKLSCFNAAMTGDDPAGIVDQHRVREAEAADAVRDLSDLLLRMGSCIPYVRLECLNACHFNISH
jgi:hypothetical protein